MAIGVRGVGRIAVAAGALVAAACGGKPAPLPDLAPSAVGDTAGLVARGEYIVRSVAVCGGCHAADPQSPDGPLSGGLAFHDWRLGTIRAANLTPDSATGLGGWTAAEIVRAIRTGSGRNGKTLAPIMPYSWFHAMSDRDAYAVARYLQTLPPVRNELRNHHSLAFFFGKAFVKPITSPVAGPPPRAPSAEYGGYLARHVALCADCHTPRGGLQSAPKMSRLFAGTDHPPKDFPANPANLTPDSATGIGEWSEGDFIRTIRAGTSPQGHHLNPFMPWHQLGRMSDDDLRAIYLYLRTLPPIRNQVPMRHEMH